FRWIKLAAVMMRIVTAVTSLPAGVLVCVQFALHMERADLRGPPPRSARGKPPTTEQVQSRAAVLVSDEADIKAVWPWLVLTMILHLTVSTYALRKPGTNILGLRVLGITCWVVFFLPIVALVVMGLTTGFH